MLGGGKLFFWLLMMAIVFLGLAPKTLAVDYSTSYKAEYTVKDEGNTHVKLTIAIVNLPRDIFLKEFSLSFPDDFRPTAVQAHSDFGPLATRVSKVKDKQHVTILFAPLEKAEEQVRQFVLEFYQKGLFEREGETLEIILPASDLQGEAESSVIVNIPQEFAGKLSIAKPKPTANLGTSVRWDAARARTIYALFGESRHFKFNLTYSLKSERLVPVRTALALPPETAYQHVLLADVSPKPIGVEIDQDGNYLLEYHLSPGQEKKVVARGYVTVRAKSQPSFDAFTTESLRAQKKYLLSPKQYWTTEGTKATLPTTGDPEQIYRFVTDSLQYDYDRVNKSVSRLGALEVLETPNSAVCREFTDLFIALARENGIFAREVNGFAISNNASLRPLSLISDLLHAWPEYYDAGVKKWIPVDPTWENTSGIDYFNSFDLNHIVFAIHGKDPNYPLPAGMYKTGASRDVAVGVVSDIPDEKEAVRISTTAKKAIDRGKKYQGEITIVNSGNVFLRDRKIVLKGNGIGTNPAFFSISLLAPLEEKKFRFFYVANKAIKGTVGSLEITLGDLYHDKVLIKLQSDYRHLLAPLLISLLGVGSLIIFVVLKK